jgi:hypothetical protein
MMDGLSFSYRSEFLTSESNSTIFFFAFSRVVGVFRQPLISPRVNAFELYEEN